MKFIFWGLTFFFINIVFSEPTSFTLGERVPQDMIVKYKKANGGISGTSSAISSVRAMIKHTISAKKFNSISETEMDHITLEDNQNLDKTIDEISSLPDVEYVEPNYILKAIDINEDAATLITRLENAAWGLLNIGILNAWQITQGHESVVTAVIDSGIDYSHQDLVNNIWINSEEDINEDGICDESDYDHIDQDGNGYIDDCVGWNFVANNNDPYDDLDHGTHVAGIIGGSGNPEILGVNRVIKLMAVKFIAHDGYGTTSDAIKSILYAVNNGARVINNSWGGTNYSRALKDVVEYSNSKNTLFVAAAGNNGTDNDRVLHYPSSYSIVNVIAVGALSEDNTMPYFSNFGSDGVDIVAPGTYIYSTIADDQYSTYSGTSMAAPFVAGVAALVLSVFPETSAYDLKRIILESNDYMPNLSGKILTSGKLNAARALALAEVGLTGKAKYAMTSKYTDPNEKEKKVQALGCGRVSGSNTSQSDFMVTIIVIFMPLLIVVGRKRRNMAFRRIARNSSKYI